MSGPAVSTRSLLKYGIIALPIAFAGFPLYVLAPDFYATHFGLSLSVLGTLLLAIRLFDAVQDPLIGWLADRLHGRLLRLTIAAACLLCLSVFGLFNVVVISPPIWFVICMMFAATSYSTLTIVVGAEGTRWTTDKNDQTRIASVRESFGLVGLVMAVSLPVILTRLVSSEGAYRYDALLLTLLMGIGLVSFRNVIQTRSGTDQGQSAAPVSLFSGLRALSRDNLHLYAVYALGMLASSIPAVLVIFYVRDLLGAESLTGVFLFLYFLSGAAGMPLWKGLSRRLGKYPAWCIANLLAVAGFIAAYFLRPGDIWPYAAVCVASGVALGADLTFPPSILADQIHAAHNERFSATHYALLAFIAKAALALASAIAFPILDMAGFKPQTDNSTVALSALAMAYAAIPCALKLSTAGLIYFLLTPSRPGATDEAP